MKNFTIYTTLGVFSSVNQTLSQAFKAAQIVNPNLKESDVTSGRITHVLNATADIQLMQAA